MRIQEFKIKGTVVYEKNYEEYQSKRHRIIVNEGGSGSSKTISLAQLFNTIMLSERGAKLTIARKTFPALRATAMKDFFDQMKALGLYSEARHNKSENVYRFGATEVDFVSVDEAIKVRSRRRNYLWMNEANEFDLEDYRQLAMRTDKQIFMDYNPSHQEHWIYDEVETRKDCLIIPSTYKDNPFLAPELVREIEGYKDKDQNYWRIYGLGQKGTAESLIYTHWKYCDKMPEKYDRRVYGLDFGFNNPTCLEEIREKDRDYYWQEIIYQSHLTNDQLIEEMKAKGVSQEDEIIADSAEPARIKAIEDAGYNILPAEKSVKDRIDFIKSHGFYIVKSSVNTAKEAKKYSWKTKDGKNLDEPVKTQDHAMDAGGYAEYHLREEDTNYIS